MMNRISHLVNSMVSLVQERSIIAIEATIVQGVGGGGDIANKLHRQSPPAQIMKQKPYPLLNSRDR